jgi:hypothetical protein
MSRAGGSWRGPGREKQKRKSGDGMALKAVPPASLSGAQVDSL